MNSDDAPAKVYMRHEYIYDAGSSIRDAYSFRDIPEHFWCRLIMKL